MYCFRPHPFCVKMGCGLHEDGVWFAKMKVWFAKMGVRFSNLRCRVLWLGV